MEETKASLRREFREARQGFAKTAGASARERIEANMIRLIRDLSEEGTCIALYRPMPGEAEFDLQPRENFFYPRIVGKDLKFLKPKGGQFIKNKFGIEEPAEGDEPSLSDILPSGRNLMFTPAVAVDSQGGRLGMGQGFYDRFFAREPDVIRVGVVFQVQVSNVPLPREKWDQALDWVVTEQMILETSTRSS